MGERTGERRGGVAGTGCAWGVGTEGRRCERSRNNTCRIVGHNILLIKNIIYNKFVLLRGQYNLYMHIQMQ